MVEFSTWPSLFFARQDKAQLKHPHHRRLFYRQKVTIIESQLTEIVATRPLPLQTDVKENDRDAFPTEALLSADLIGGFKNTSRPKRPASIEIVSTSTYTTVPSKLFDISSNTITTSLTASSSSVMESYPTTAVLILSASLGFGQGQNILSLAPVYHSPSTYSALNINSNSTSCKCQTSISYNQVLMILAISSRSSSSIHLNPSSLVKSTSRLSLASFVITTTDSYMSGFFEAQTASLSSLPTEPVDHPQVISPTSVISTQSEDIGKGETTASFSDSTPTGDAYHSSHHSPYTPVVVGGIMGSIAGTAMIIFFIVLLLRWQKVNKWIVPLENDDTLAIHGVARGDHSRSSGDMTQQRLSNFSISAILASLTATNLLTRKKSKLQLPEGADEKGFYRVSGRKLPSVLQYGGDGYGGDAQRSNTLVGSSLNCDSQWLYSGSENLIKLNEATNMPQHVHDNPRINPNSSLNSVVEQDQLKPPILKPPQLPDAIGRSRPSMDSSLTSRFTEDI